MAVALRTSRTSRGGDLLCALDSSYLEWPCHFPVSSMTLATSPAFPDCISLPIDDNTMGLL